MKLRIPLPHNSILKNKRNHNTNNKSPSKNKKQPLYTLSLICRNKSDMPNKNNQKPMKDSWTKGLISPDIQSKDSNYLNIEVGEYKDYSRLFNDINLNVTLEEYEYDLSSFIKNNHNILSTSIDNQQTTIVITEMNTSEMKDTDHINKIYDSIEPKFIEEDLIINR